MRVAAANMVSLRELLNGFEEQYGQVLTNVPIDYAIPDAAVAALSQFCRVAPEKIRTLDLRQRIPHLNLVLLLRYPQDLSLLWCPRCSERRVRYAFCPLCLARQPVIHLRWDWSVACLIRCAVHRAPLLDACPACGEPDPLTFSGFDSPPSPVCRSCGGDLTVAQSGALLDVQPKRDIQAVEDAYRAMLLGIAPDPALLGKATDRAFRKFVEDMLQFLRRSLSPSSLWHTTDVPFSSRDILQIITALIENAAPSSDRRVRSRRHSHGLTLWATLFKFIPEYEGSSIEQSSLCWPVSLRRRFISARYYRIKKRWPYSPYGTKVDWRIEQRELAAIYGLRPPLQTPIQTADAGSGRL
jgi:hypothetical protein